MVSPELKTCSEYRDTGLNTYRDTGLRDTGLNTYRDTGLNTYRDTWLNTYRNAGLNILKVVSVTNILENMVHCEQNEGMYTVIQ